MQRLPVPEAALYWLPRLPLPEPDAALMQALQQQTAWRAEELLLWGRRRLQPRLTAWHGDAGMVYRYSGLQLSPAPWTPLLQAVRDAVQRACGQAFNSVLLNWYRDERDSIGLHSDDEPALGPQPVIASLSLGETRTLVLRHRSDAAIAPVRLALTSGSLLLMAGQTQRCWKHGIAKQARRCGPRLNLTFRRIVAPD